MKVTCQYGIKALPPIVYKVRKTTKGILWWKKTTVTATCEYSVITMPLKAWEDNKYFLLIGGNRFEYEE